jgi:hypothetical protein
MWFAAEVAGRFAAEALALGAGEVCALFQRSFYLRLPGGRYACVGDVSLGRGPLNALVHDFRPPALGDKVVVRVEHIWLGSAPPCLHHHQWSVKQLREAARGRIPMQGLGCLIVGEHNALSAHAQPALDALDQWLVGGDLREPSALLIGLGPGLTPSGDDYLGGMMVALRAAGRGRQADALWRWLSPRLPAATSAISAAHLAAAAAGEAHEALQECLDRLSLANGEADWQAALDRLDRVGHCSGWDALAGALAVVRSA